VRTVGITLHRLVCLRHLGCGWRDEGAGAAAGAGFGRGLLHYVAQGDQELAELGALFEFHIHNFEGASLGVGIANDREDLHGFCRGVEFQIYETSRVQALLADCHAAAEGELGNIEVAIFF